MKILVLIVLAALIYQGYKHNSFDKLKMLWSKIKASFDNPKDSENKFQTNGVIPNNVRKDIIKNNYLFLVRDDSIEKSRGKNKESKQNEDSTNDSKYSDENIVKNMDHNTVLADKNGEAHSLYDLSTTHYKQKSESSKKVVYDIKDK